MEAPESDGDTGRVSATGTPMLKSVIILMSKQRDRVLTMKKCPYLNEWADPIFKDVIRGLGHSGDPIGSSPWCSWRPQSEQAAEVSDGIGAVAGSDVKRRIECCDRALPPVMRVVSRARG
ncbi:hypothetical protein TIFTF001_004743 [Ficus carica]|uniref:Uncharacterized protein n=1 Tax=Ficus carica TaxID=3494 RepID=A0AA88CXQ2_FICCA|nr:hypothetical protein TIFTF001_004743 [Ficus carica]